MAEESRNVHVANGPQSSQETPEQAEQLVNKDEPGSGEQTTIQMPTERETEIPAAKVSVWSAVFLPFHVTMFEQKGLNKHGATNRFAARVCFSALI